MAHTRGRLVTSWPLRCASANPGADARRQPE